VANFSAAAKNMKSSTENLNSVTAKIEKGEGTVGGLISDPTVYYDLKTLMGKANRSKLLKIVIRHVLSKNEKDTLK
jgi:phospholipid/cholesterol/gamma-HCH transport system substrate-binding protein